MKQIVCPLALLIVTLLAGCAAPDGTQVAEEKEYRTGSNIAQRTNRVHDSVQTLQVNTADPNLGLPMGNRSPLPQGH